MLSSLIFTETISVEAVLTLKGSLTWYVGASETSGGVLRNLVGGGQTGWWGKGKRTTTPETCLYPHAERSIQSYKQSPLSWAPITVMIDPIIAKIDMILDLIDPIKTAIGLNQFCDWASSFVIPPSPCITLTRLDDLL